MFPHLYYSSPRNLPDPLNLQGQTVVLDLAFCSENLNPSYAKMTGPFIDELGGRLALWVDHHDHPYHQYFKGDPRFFLAGKQQYPACTTMITPQLVQKAGPVDTIVCHGDLDGLYCAAKWINGGEEIYQGFDKDAEIIDARTGKAGKIACTIDNALRAEYRNLDLKNRIIQFLVTYPETKKSFLWKAIKSSAAAFLPLAQKSKELSRFFQIKKQIAYLKIEAGTRFDKTTLLLEGQKITPVAIIEFSGNITIAVSFDSNINLLDILDIGGGMPTRVTLPASRKEMVFKRLQTALGSK
ncbi:MAG: hypothetical protein PF689_14690 [Deltaproteobacteria bacterium]|jgi:hypothetical protein|nr:hypothetical protein [Deltaproteobacteria bacterium]